MKADESAETGKTAAITTEPSKAPSDTVGTGSYVAVSCSLLTVLATLLLIAGLLVARWLT